MGQVFGSLPWQLADFDFGNQLVYSMYIIYLKKKYTHTHIYIYIYILIRSYASFFIRHLEIESRRTNRMVFVEFADF